MKKVIPCLLAAALAASTVVAAPIRVVNCGEKVASKKRGICMNNMSAADFRALAPGVSWYYNWHYKTDSNPPAGVKMTFIPMVWGNRPDALAGLPAVLAGANPKPPIVFAINEPNLKGQAFISPQVTAEVFKKVKVIADKFKIPVVGPHMAIGSGANSSIKAMDPITKKEETYTFMVPFLKAFFHYLGDPSQVAGLGVHSYENIGELKWSASEMYKQFKRPVWMTEYAQWNVKSLEEARDYLIASTDYLERSKEVEGYAWFKERSDRAVISLLERQPGKLSILGEAYVALPPHDADLFYRLPGKLPAECFVDAQGMEIKAAKEPGDVLVLAVTSGAAFVDYNIQVDTAAEYTLRFRLAGTGKIDVLGGTTVMGTVESKDPKWNVVETKIKFPAGTGKIRLRATGLLKAIDSIEFAKQ
jgi:hypothetical protein